MKLSKGKLHFINHFEKLYAPANVGDWISSPYSYFADYFSQYTCVMHSIWYILWHEIEKDDIVIFGGGGLLDNSTALNCVINNLFDKCDNVIIWGAGTHKYKENNEFGMTAPEIEINFDKAAFCGIRDYGHPYNMPFVPCVSCLNIAFDIDKENIAIEREVGTVTSALEPSFAVSDVPSSLSNAESIGRLVKYMASSRVVLVSSYHGAYWSLLLGRKVVLPSSRMNIDKYRYFRHPVGFYDKSNFDEAEILNIASKIPEQHNFLEEARTLNINFFRKVRDYIEDRISVNSENEIIATMAKRIAQLEFTVADMWKFIMTINSNSSGANEQNES